MRGPLLQSDEDKIRRLLKWAEENEDKAERWTWPTVFEQWLENGKELTTRQREWLHGIYERTFDEPIYENAWSAGKVPRGERSATPVPEVLRKPLPMKPPGGRA